MSSAPADPHSDFFSPSVRWCRDAASRFALRESLEAGGEEEVAVIQHDVALRLWRFLATVARRATTLGNSSLRLASAESFEDDVAVAIGERLGFQMPEDRDLLDCLATEFHTWLVEDNQGQRATPWGTLRATGEETGMEVVPLAASHRPPQRPSGIDAPTGGVETRTPRPAGRAVAASVATPVLRGVRLRD